MSLNLHRLCSLLGMTALAFGLTPSTASAQAFLPPKGEGTVTLLYQETLIRYHELGGSEKVAAGHIKTHTMLVDFTYGLKDRIAVSFAIPWVALRYEGPSPHTMVGIPDEYQDPYTPI